MGLEHQYRSRTVRLRGQRSDIACEPCYPHMSVFRGNFVMALTRLSKAPWVWGMLRAWFLPQLWAPDLDHPTLMQGETEV